MQSQFDVHDCVSPQFHSFSAYGVFNSSRHHELHHDKVAVVHCLECRVGRVNCIVLKRYEFAELHL